MGGCLSGQQPSQAELKARKEEKIRNRWIDSSLIKEKEVDKGAIKLLFLGAGESGKSTLLKQMTILHGQGFSNEEREGFLPLIHSNVISSMKLLIRQSKEFAATMPECALSPEAAANAKLVEELKFDDRLTEKVAATVAALWKDPAIQNTYSHKSQFQLTDSAKYFFEKVMQVASPKYSPDDSDILRARIRTTGIVEHRFQIGPNDFRMYDVGGQRNARKKWIHCFEKVTSVIFVAAISGYDQKIVEDNKTNSLVEALNLFEDICESRWFIKTAMILFLNKKDIFKEKIKVTPLTECFPDYDGPNDYHHCCEYIKAEFKARNKQPQKRIYTHFTCATDTLNIKKVFDDVQAIILRAHLLDVGLMDASADLFERQAPAENSDDDLKDELSDDGRS